MPVKGRIRWVFAAGILAVGVPAAGCAQTTAAGRAAAYVEKAWHSHLAPGRSIAVARGGRIVWATSLGYADLANKVPATNETVYNIGSVSKAVTVVAVMQLVERGKVGLDDPIQKYVPTFPDKGVPITIREILTHTSGIRHYHDSDFPGNPDLENMRRYRSLAEGITVFKDDPLLFRPGGYYHYSSYAVDLLQGVVETASGEPFEDYMRAHVWRPAGMASTQFDVPDRVVPHRATGHWERDGRAVAIPYEDLTYKFAAGGMISTASDLARLGVALEHGGLLKPETVALMWRPQLDSVIEFDAHGPPKRASFDQGFIWILVRDSAGRRVVYHTGSVKGSRACLLIYPDQDLVVADVANGYDSGSHDEDVAVAGFFLGGVTR